MGRALYTARNRYAHGFLKRLCCHSYGPPIQSERELRIGRPSRTLGELMGEFTRHVRRVALPAVGTEGGLLTRDSIHKRARVTNLAFLVRSSLPQASNLDPLRH